MRPRHPESCRLIVGTFRDPAGVLDAVRAARSGGLQVVDVYGPLPIHGIDEAMGLRRTRLPVACLVLGLLGLSGALLLQYWTSAVDWPINVGGKPFDSLPAFVPIAFEMTVLLSGLGTVALFFARSRLLPGRRPAVSYQGVTDDRFAVVVRETGSVVDDQELGKIWSSFGLLEMHVELEEVSR